MNGSQHRFHLFINYCCYTRNSPFPLSGYNWKISTDKKTKFVIFILDFFLLFELNQFNSNQVVVLKVVLIKSSLFSSSSSFFFFFFINVFLQMKERICGKTESELR